MTTLRYISMRPEHAPALAELQRICFPFSKPDALFQAQDLVKHAEVFPEGNFTVLDGSQPIGMATGLWADFDFDQPQHHIDDFGGEHGIGNHDPNGLYYYGTDISVHPDYRRRGIGQALYDTRKALVRRYNRKGIIAGGVLPGMANYLGQMSVEDYVARVVAGTLYDPTLTFQLANGFVVQGVLHNYFDDARSNHAASLIYWENREYVA